MCIDNLIWSSQPTRKSTHIAIPNLQMQKSKPQEACVDPATY